MTARTPVTSHAENRGPGGCVPWEEHDRALTNCERFHVDESVHDAEIKELRDELDRLRRENSEYRKSMKEHATDPDQPCEACQEVLLSY